jgi:hypothetical protein
MCSQEKCEKMVSELMRSNENLKILLDPNKVGNLKINCRSCEDKGFEKAIQGAFGFKPEPEILLCTNRLKTQKDVENVLIHESVHAHDYFNKICDFNSCEGTAYTEVRAFREAQCTSKYLPYNWMKKPCVWFYARKSTELCGYDQIDSEHCLAAVFEKAMRDKRPWGENENSGSEKRI